MPLLGYPRAAGVPAVSVRHWTGGASPIASLAHAHAHDFLVLLHVVAGSTGTRVDGREWRLGAGDAFVVAPGAVVAPGESGPGADIWAVFFPADMVDPAAAAPLVSWRGHPLLAPFAGAHRGGAQRLPVPEPERPAWAAHLRALDAELRARRDGYAEAVRAHLTLLLVRLGRLGAAGPDLGVDPLVARALEIVEQRYAEPISLRDVAAAVGLTPGHLTTVVRQATGRTVQQWLTERRMREARRLLADTDLPVAEVAGRVGYRDPGYFVRRFRAAHAETPTGWRLSGT